MTINRSGTALADFQEGSVNAATRAANTTAADIAPDVIEGIELFGDDPGIRFAMAASAEKWAAFYVKKVSTAGTRSMLTFFGGAEVALFEIQHNGNNISYRYWNGSSWTALGTFALSDGVLYRVDLRALMNNSTGELALYVDGTLEQSFSGDTILDVPTTINEVRFRHGNAVAADKTVFSGLIFADEDTRDMEMASAAITADSATNTAWTGGFADVDEAGINDTDFILTTAAANNETYIWGDLPAKFNSGYDVVGVGVVARSAKGSTGPAFVKPAVYSNITLGAGDSKSLDLVYEPAYHFFTQDPDTVAAWTVSGVNASEIGVQSSAS